MPLIKKKKIFCLSTRMNELLSRYKRKFVTNILCKKYAREAHLYLLAANNFSKYICECESSDLDFEQRLKIYILYFALLSRNYRVTTIRETSLKYLYPRRVNVEVELSRILTHKKDFAMTLLLSYIDHFFLSC